MGSTDRLHGAATLSAARTSASTRKLHHHAHSKFNLS
jgi:hypothetical protein